MCIARSIEVRLGLVESTQTKGQKGNLQVRLKSRKQARCSSGHGHCCTGRVGRDKTNKTRLRFGGRQTTNHAGVWGLNRVGSWEGSPLLNAHKTPPGRACVLVQLNLIESNFKKPRTHTHEADEDDTEEPSTFIFTRPAAGVAITTPARYRGLVG